MTVPAVLAIAVLDAASRGHTVRRRTRISSRGGITTARILTATLLAALTAGAGEIYVPGDVFRNMKPEDLRREACERAMKLWKGPCDEAAFATYANERKWGMGTDEELRAFVPSTISPRGRIRGVPYPEIRPWAHWTGHFTRDQHDSYYAFASFKGVCPFCDDHGSAVEFDNDNPEHAWMSCCRKDLWRNGAPADYDLRPDATAKFRYLDDSIREIPCKLYTDAKGRTWELFIHNIFNDRDWVKTGSMIRQCGWQFAKHGDPYLAYKCAVLIDRVAETYYALPLVLDNLNMAGKDGLGLTRAEWEAFPGRPNIWARMPKEGWWNRGIPFNGRGWAIEGGEGYATYYFALLRHHPAFKYYSKLRYGDENRLNELVCRKYAREVSMNYTSISISGLIHNYQAAQTQVMLVNALLGGDKNLLEFAGACVDVEVYNHHYPDGQNGEGAPSYQAMLSRFYHMMTNPDEWLTIDPTFPERTPFFRMEAESLDELVTSRGKMFEQGDRHFYIHEFEKDPHYGRKLDTNAIPAKASLKSRVWPSWGSAVLRGGSGTNRLEAILHFARPVRHGSKPMALACWFDGIPCLRPHGYAAPWGCLEQPAIDELNKLNFPHKAILCEDEVKGDVHHRWIRTLVHSPIGENTVSVDGLMAIRNGLTEPVLFKGDGVMQIAEAKASRDYCQLGGNTNYKGYGRAVAMVTTPSGRAYALDFTTFQGGVTQTVWYSMWGERAGQKGLPDVPARGTLLDIDFGGTRPKRPNWMRGDEWLSLYNWMDHVNKMQVRGDQDDPWSVDYDIDYYAYYRDQNGKEYGRPCLGFGKAVFRLAGTPTPGHSPYAVLQAKCPWSALLVHQPKLGGKGRFHTETATFEDGVDVLGLRRTASGNARHTVTVALMEGRHPGEKPVVASLESFAMGRARILTVHPSEGGEDVVVYNPDYRRLEGCGISTDARFAFLRRDASGRIIRREMAEGTYMKVGGKMELSASAAFDEGEIVRLRGDLTGDTGVSELYVRPKASWDVSRLAGRMLLWEMTREGNFANDEGCLIERADVCPDGLVRLSLAGPMPFIISWHQLFKVDGRWAVNREIRKYEYPSYYTGLKMTFPRKGNQTVAIKSIGVLAGTQIPCSTIEPAEDLESIGIGAGDWFYICGARPGQKIRVSRVTER